MEGSYLGIGSTDFLENLRGAPLASSLWTAKEIRKFRRAVQFDRPEMHPYESNRTGIGPEQFWGKSAMHGVLVHQSRGPNNPKQLRCEAVPSAVPTHDATIASSGTGTAGPLMGAMHSPRVRGEAKDDMTEVP